MTSSETTFNDAELIARLRLPWFTNGCEDYQLEAADRIEQLAVTNEALTKERDELHDRITAMETGDWSEVRLVRFENRQFDLTALPIPAIAEYLAQMMEDGKGEYFNFMEVQINHKSAGPMVLSLQRKHGKTPNELRKEAEAKLAKAEAAIYRIAPYLSASLSELDCGPDYIEACNQVFEADSITLAEIKGESHE